MNGVELRKLGTFSEMKYGKMPKKDRITEDGQYPIYSGYRIVGYYNEYNLEQPTLIVVARGVGGTGDVKISPAKCYLTNLSIYVDVDESVALKEYLYYYFQIHNLRYLDSGSAQSQITIADLKNVEVPIPTLETQDKVVSILKSLDNKIANNEAINRNLEQQAQSLYKSWFIDFEPFNGSMPAEWRTSTLGEVSLMGAGGDKPEIVSETKSEECQIPIYSNGINDEGLYGFTDKPKISEESVTVSARGTIGFVCLRHVPYVPIVRLVTLIPDKSQITAKYLYLYLNQIHIAGTGTTQQQLTVPDFRKTKIIVPTKELCEKFTEIVDPMYYRIWHNQDENIKLSNLRDTLLPRLMSGELDVSEVELE